MRRGNSRSLLFSALAAGAYVYFTKPENREKAMVTFNNLKTKANSYMQNQHVKPTLMTKTGHSDPNDPDDNRMVEEGAMTSVQYYNEEYQDKVKKAEAKAAFPKSQKKKLPDTAESLAEDNNESPAKQENAARDSFGK
ncbi:MAG: hypothetical protein ACE3JQ_03775 [Paenisporosarcina sp.]